MWDSYGNVLYHLLEKGGCSIIQCKNQCCSHLLSHTHVQVVTKCTLPALLSRTTADPACHWMTLSALKERGKLWQALPVPRAEQWRGCTSWALQSLTPPFVGLILVTDTIQLCHFKVRYLKLIMHETLPSQLIFIHGAEVRQHQCSKKAVPKWP